MRKSERTYEAMPRGKLQPLERITMPTGKHSGAAEMQKDFSENARRNAQMANRREEAPPEQLQSVYEFQDRTVAVRPQAWLESRQRFASESTNAARDQLRN